jgi:hypothetical protein
LNVKAIQEVELRFATACNYKDGEDWIVDVYINKIHKNTGYKKIAERINNLFLIEFICSIIRCNSEGEKPPCEQKEFSIRYSRCPCYHPLNNGMKLNVF